ncbi:efflux RND transporter periplasmic adaptor subunit [Gynuella sp.]|uniref:efflux RND transporter periplasmic adaptor subunit n=1 Tax=Gynuella sp. TaxID=2969146 RepID=UPI003D13947D
MHQFKLLLFAALLCSFCSFATAEGEVTASNQTRKVKLYRVEQNGVAGIRTFPADIVSENSANLSFKVPGQIKSLSIKKGEMVRKGQVLATLDDTDYRVQMDSANASYSLASAQYERIRESALKAVTTAAQLDEARASLEQAKAALDNATNQLAYTVIKAPFDGMVADTYQDQEEYVGAATPVLTLIQVEPLNVAFDAPASLLARLSDHVKAKEYHPAVIFDQLPGRTFTSTFKEMTTIPDAGTRSYSIVLSLPKPAEINGIVLPGMTAKVLVDIGELLDNGKIGVLAPVESVFYRPGSENKYVWLYDESTHTISARAVQGDELLGNSIVITEGLNKGDQIVAAGTYLLYEGQTITPWTSMGDK